MTRETAKTQICSHCKSNQFQVHHYLREGHHNRIFLQCTQCNEMASRLIIHAHIAPNTYSSFLQKVARLGHMGPRDIIETYKIHEKRAQEQFSHVLDILKKLKNNSIADTTSIVDICSEYNIIEDESN